MKEIQEKIKKFDPISLKEMDAVSLLNRTDTKYVFHYNILVEILDVLMQYYKILEIGDKRTNEYRTQYFDTVTNKLFTLHQNEKKNRYKIRFRKYKDSGLCFLEIKFKNNKGRTIKKRTKKDDFESGLTSVSKEFISENSNLNSEELIPAIWNEFTRLTLVHKTNKERLTIDFNVEFEKDGCCERLENIIIAEVKRDGASAHSDFVDIMKQKHIRPMSISKYCIGAVLLNKKIKYNNFKPKVLAVKKISNGNFN